MKPSTKRVMVWIALVLVATAVMTVVTQFILRHDNALPIIEQHLAADKQVIERTGSINQTTIVKKVSVSEGATGRAHRIYTVVVRGDKSTVAVEVKMEKVEGENVVSIRAIHS